MNSKKYGVPDDCDLENCNVYPEKDIHYNIPTIKPKFIGKNILLS